MNSVHSWSAALISASTSIQRSMVAIVPSSGCRYRSTRVSPPTSAVKQRRSGADAAARSPHPHPPQGGRRPAEAGRRPGLFAARRHPGAGAAAGAGRGRPCAASGRGRSCGRRRDGSAAAPARRRGGTGARLRGDRRWRRVATARGPRPPPSSSASTRAMRAHAAGRSPFGRRWPRRRSSSGTRRTDRSCSPRTGCTPAAMSFLELRAVAGRACFAYVPAGGAVEQARADDA